MIIYHDEEFGFYEIFNEKNGTLIRGDDSLGQDPIMRAYPELLDVGIMGFCDNQTWCQQAGIDCYQKGGVNHSEHMSVEDFEKIARQSAGKTFQIALGGAGDPNKHPCFEEILSICRYYNIVPNITTSGKGITEKEIQLIKEYCGAVAVSWYSRLIDGIESNRDTLNAVNSLKDAGCLTNIHYVVSRDTIDEAVIRLATNQFPLGINAVIFILYKPVGYGKDEKKIRYGNPNLNAFMESVLKCHPYRIGFDTCFTSALVDHLGIVPKESIDACEAATFSMYIDSNLNCYPCSFGLWKEGASVSCKDKSIREVWNSEKFNKFREMRKSCIDCKSSSICRGGCMLNLGIELCDQKGKE